MKNLIIVFLFISVSALGQEFNLDIHNTSLSEYLRMEANLGSERITTTSNHVSFSGDAQPIKFLRKEKILPDLITYYFFKEKDSTMSSIRYEWDVYNFEKQQNNQKSKEFEKALIDKYKKLKENISKDYGQPEVKRNYSNISRLDSLNTFVESSTWKPNDTTEIEMYATVSNYYENRGSSVINPTHRIRLYVKNQSKEEKTSPKLDEKKLSELDEVKNDFFQALSSGDLEKSRDYLSDLIKNNVTDEQLNMLISNLKFEHETELIFSGVQIGLNGGVFISLQYKYADDKSSPPSEMVKLVFDDKDKIAGIQPIQLQSSVTD
ncbi:hypothetical protein ACXYMT_13435 [Salinimicrobium sp. CAU 1759]